MEFGKGREGVGEEGRSLWRRGEGKSYKRLDFKRVGVGGKMERRGEKGGGILYVGGFFSLGEERVECRDELVVCWGWCVGRGFWFCGGIGRFCVFGWCGLEWRCGVGGFVSFLGFFC